MKRLFEKICWTYRDGKFRAEGGRENKQFGSIYFKVEVDPMCGDGSIKFTSLEFSALNKTVLVTAGMEEVERVIEEYYEYHYHWRCRLYWKPCSMPFRKQISRI